MCTQQVRLGAWQALVTALVLGTLLGGSASAQPLDRYWNVDPSRVNDCLGNCGAGCSNFFPLNLPWWCNEGRGWEIIPHGPEEVVNYFGESSYCVGEERCTSQYAVVQIYATATYWGWFDEGCYIHDIWCWENPGPCIAPPLWWWEMVCDNQYEQGWSYTDYLRAVVPVDTVCEYAYPECPELAFHRKGDGDDSKK